MLSVLVSRPFRTVRIPSRKEVTVMLRLFFRLTRLFTLRPSEQITVRLSEGRLSLFGIPGIRF